MRFCLIDPLYKVIVCFNIIGFVSVGICALFLDAFK